jgi:hypothetical protein
VILPCGCVLVAVTSDLATRQGVLAAGLLVRLEIRGEYPSPVRGGADREAARVRIVVGDEDDEGEADHQGYRAGAGGVEGGAARTDKDGVAEDDDRTEHNQPNDRGRQATVGIGEPVPAGGNDIVEAPDGVLVERRGRGRAGFTACIAR